MSDVPRLRGRRVVVVAVIVAVVTAAGVLTGPGLVFEGSRWWRVRSVGTVLSADRDTIVVPHGSRFALHWELAVVPCTGWQVVDPVPDAGLISQVGRERRRTYRVTVT